MAKPRIRTLPPPPSVPLGRHLAAFSALALLVFAVYSPALCGEFQFDDAMGIERGLWRLPRGQEIVGILGTLSSWTGRGLVQATYQFNFWIGGGNEMKFHDLNRITASFHLFNILFHASTSGALYFLLAWMARRRGRPSLALPFLGTALFALHPLAAESVAYISARSGTMAACFGLWGIAGFVAYGTPGPDGEPSPLASRILAVALLALGSFLAVGCKETGWMIPPMGAVLLAWGYQGDRRALRRDWGALILLGALVFSVAMIAFLSRVSLVDAVLDQYRSTYAAPLPDAAFCHVLTQLNAWSTVHLPRLLLPWGPWHMTVDTSPPLLARPDGAAWALASLQALVLLALAVWGWRAWRRRELPAVGVLWILLGVVPVSAGALLDVTTERHAYMPLAGAAVALTGLLERAARRRWIPAVAGLCLCLLTAHRAVDWAAEEALWRAAIRDAPGKPRPWYNWAKSVNRRAMRVAEAEGPKAADLVRAAQGGFRASLRIFPGFHIAHSGLARTCQWQGRWEEAVEEYRKAVEAHEMALWRGEAPNMHAQQITFLSRTLAQLLHELGRDAEAEQAFLQPVEYHLKALQQGVEGFRKECHQHGAVEILRALVLFQSETGHVERARLTLRNALRIFPGWRPLTDLQGRLGEKR